MYLKTFEENMLNIIGENFNSKKVKEFQIIKYKFGGGNTIKLKVREGKVARIEAKGTNAEKFLEIYKENHKKS